MKLRVSFFLLFGLIFTILSCNESINSSSIAPSKVYWVKPSDSDSAIERGIDAIPEQDAIQLHWIPLSESNVEGYEIWRSEDIDSKFSKLTNQEQQDSIYIDLSVEVTQKYYYVIVAVNKDNIKGEYSDTVSYQLLHKARFLSPEGDIAEKYPVFSWEDPNQASSYYLRLYEQQSNQLIWIPLIQSSYSNRETIQFNHDSSAVSTPLKSGYDYYWRIDVVGSSNASGSESRWALFHVQ